MTEQTVFVIGAGASKEVGLPTGAELKSEIARLLDLRFNKWEPKNNRGDPLILQTLLHEIPNDSNYQVAAWHIRDAMPQAESIDNFIDQHQGNKGIELCGKLAIVQSILKAERRSSLHFEKRGNDSNINFATLIDTWYTPFFQLITKNCKKEELKGRFGYFTLIIFNYDRCVEHFLFCSLMNYYKISETEAAEIMKSLNIYHPYGCVGSLPWDQPKVKMEFGGEPNRSQLVSLASQIRTFTEGSDPHSSEIQNLHYRMGWANKLVFLGFSFQDLNMKLISSKELLTKVTDAPKTAVKCFATTHGFSQGDEPVINEQITDLYNRKVEVDSVPAKCGKFFTEFQKRLAL